MKGIGPMSSRVNLNDNVNERYEFSVGGLDYDFVYPTLTAIEPITELYNQREAEEAKDTPESKEKIKEIDQKLTDVLYSFVVPVGHMTPIKETLEKQPYPVIKAFNKMMTEQLSAE